MRTFSFLLLTFIVFTSVKTSAAKNSINHEIVDSLLKYSKNKTYVDSMVIIRDTLKILTLNKKLYYPYGKFSSFNSFKAGYLDKNVKNYSERTYHKYFKNYEIKKGSSILRLTLDPDTRYIEIINGTICDNSFEIMDKIRVGDTFESVLKKYFYKIPLALSNVRTIVFQSTLTGIWYYLYFENGKLMRIVIKTDFIQ